MIDLPPPPPPPAYVIIIQADDLGYDDLAINGNTLIETPNLDQLARESVSATQFTVNPVCSASRASLLTGRHFLRTGVSHVHGGKDFLHRDEITLADVFGEAGWNTATWGKWHSGKTDGYYPWDRGFDEAYMSNLYQHRNAIGFFNGEEVRTEKWSDDLIIDYAINYLKQHRGEPSFLYLASMTPHTPLDCPDAFQQKYLDKGLSDNLATLYGMISFLDQQIGRLLEFLDDEGIADNTLLLFISDNGPAINNGILSDEDRAIRKTSARRGWKGDIWENGVRSPFMMSWPARLKKRVIRAKLDQVDLYPTLLELCGIPLPQGQSPLDGKSIAADLLSGNEPVGHAIFNYAHPGWITSKRPYTPVGLPGEYNPITPEQKPMLSALDQPISITEGRYKLLFNPFVPEANPSDESRFMLVDLLQDPGEAMDIKSDNPETYSLLKEKLTSWYEGIIASPHSYTSPVSKIGSTVKLEADSVCRLSESMQNTVFYVQGWNEVGQFAEYQVEVDEPGEYRVLLEWLEQPAEGHSIELECMDTFTTGTTDGSRITDLGPILLGAGPGKLRITLKDVLGKQKGRFKLQWIRIQHK